MAVRSGIQFETKSQPVRALRARGRIGKYRLVRRLGEGGFAQVWMANDAIEGISVALKAPLSGPLSQDTLAALRREIRLTARLDHPNILKIKNADFIDGHLVVAYPAAERSLADRIRHRINTAAAYDIQVQILEALAYAHSKRIIHCDVKPDNVLLFPGGVARLCDFGIARIALRTVAAGSGSGTIGYLAPEQAFGKPSFRSDVFSAGLILYRMLAGVLPEWPFKWPLPGFDRLERKVSPAMLKVLQRSLQLQSGRRFANAGKMLEAFRAARSAEDSPKKSGVKRKAAARTTTKKTAATKAAMKKAAMKKAAKKKVASTSKKKKKKTAATSKKKVRAKAPRPKKKVPARKAARQGAKKRKKKKGAR